MVAGSEITELFRSSVCSGVELEELGADEYLVHTGFSYSDGDELRIVLNTSGKKWVLTDEGHTMMWLSYEDYKMTDSRNDLLSRILLSNSVQMDDGRIRVEFDPGTAGRALNSIIQAMLRVSDLRFLDTKRVRSTFIEDMKNVFKYSDLAPKCVFDKEIEIDGVRFKADVCIETKRPILLFGVTNTVNCLNVIINMMRLRMVKTDYLCCVVSEKLDGLSAKDRKLLLNTSDKVAEGLEDLMSSTVRLMDISEANA